MITGSFPPLVCGVGDYTARLSRALARLGHSITVVTHAGAGREGEGSAISEVELRPVMENWSLAATGMLLGELKRSRPDVISVQYPASGYRNRLLVNALPVFLRLTGSIPYALTLHEFRFSHPLRKLSTVFLVSMASRVVVADESERQALSRFYPESVIQRVDLIRIGSNIDVSNRLEPNGEDLGFLGREAVVSFFGLITSKKDIESLFQAFAQLVRSGHDLSLLMIGDVAFDSQRYLHLSRLADELRISDNVHWTGRCSSEEVSWYLQQSDICVLPYADGATLRRGSLIAALRHGLPIVTTWREATVPSLLRDQEGVCLVRVGDIEAMADAVSRLLDDSSWRAELRLQAAALGRRFDWHTIAERYQSLLSRLS